MEWKRKALPGRVGASRSSLSLWRLRSLRQRALQESGAQAVSRLIADTRNGKLELGGKLASVTCCQRRSIHVQVTQLIHHEEITNDDDELQTEELHATPCPPKTGVACGPVNRRGNSKVS